MIKVENLFKIFSYLFYLNLIILFLKIFNELIFRWGFVKFVFLIFRGINGLSWFYMESSYRWNLIIWESFYVD